MVPQTCSLFAFLPLAQLAFCVSPALVSVFYQYTELNLLSLSLLVKAEDYKCLLPMPTKDRAHCHASLYSKYSIKQLKDQSSLKWEITIFHYFSSIYHSNGIIIIA